MHSLINFVGCVHSHQQANLSLAFHLFALLFILKLSPFPSQSSNQSRLRAKKMANARLARFITEAAPPQIVSVMRRRTSKVLDTITEEDREYASPNDSLNSSPKGSSALPSSSPSAPSFGSAAAAGTDAKYFLKGVHRSLSMFRCH
ncbi:hypothetical protein RchiOBHm_Chr5g0014631 [Rosa chinensis]|uniref:Uncharacterized protein n=1 Tax=Rosa chinensis TaxID=74649 RepID=A0A2P6Q5Q7_ROSCH|nr:hypothetical protein RchiOBHm_Chr5g0014631 [Rosa chinensis]